MTQLSKHFSLAEMTVTSTGLDNSPEPDHIAALELTAFGMEQVRAILGNVPIIVTSGYRNRKVNAAVGGVSNSDHALGYACDFHCKTISAREICQRLAASYLVFDQLILERMDKVVHISFNPRLRRDVLRQPGGPGTQIFKGL